jgi:hypothetical protein
MKCAHWTDDSRTERTESGRVVVIEDAQRCTKNATHWLHAPDGRKVPGCWYCEQHATACVDEYREKLGEVWTARPIDHLGNLVEAG